MLSSERLDEVEEKSRGSCYLGRMRAVIPPQIGEGLYGKLSYHCCVHLVGDCRLLTISPPTRYLNWRTKSLRLSAPRRIWEIVKRQIGLEQNIQLGVAHWLDEVEQERGKSEAAMLARC